MDSSEKHDPSKRHAERIKKFRASAEESAALARTYTRHAWYGYVWGAILIVWSIVSVVLVPQIAVAIWATLALLLGLNSFRNARRDKTHRRHVRADVVFYLDEIKDIKAHVESMAAMDKEHIEGMAAMDKEFIEWLETQTAMLQKQYAGKPH